MEEEDTVLEECQRIRVAFEKIERCFQNNALKHEQKAHQLVLHYRSCRYHLCTCKEFHRRLNYCLEANFSPFPDFKDEKLLSIHIYHASKCLLVNCSLKHCDEVRKVIKEYNTELLSQCNGSVTFSDTSWFKETDHIAISIDYHIFCNTCIGEGAFGRVYYQWLEKNNLDCAVAVKVTSHDIANDILIAKLGQHSNLGTAQLIIEMQDQSFLIFMEKAECSLLDYVRNNLPKPFPEFVAIIYMKQILSALSFLHENGIVHGDVKGRNIVLTSGMQKAQLIDFSGVAKVNGHSQMHFTPGFAPPEAFRENVAIASSLDMYSFGVVVCEMFFGDMKITENVEDIQVRHQHFTEKLFGINADIAKVVRDCLRVDPTSRPSADNILEQIESNKNLQTQSVVIPNFHRRRHLMRRQSVFHYLEKKLISYMDIHLKKQLPPKVVCEQHALDIYAWGQTNE